MKRRLKIATVFSGIGAIEQALLRLNLPNRDYLAFHREKIFKGV